MRWTGRAFLLFALVSALCGASVANRQPPSVAPAGPTAATDPLPAGIAPALAPALVRDAEGFYAPRPASDGTPGLVASNPAQHLIARFLPDAVRLHGDMTSPSDGTSWGMRLLRTGYGEDLRAVPPALPAIDGNRVTYARGDATEWYLNSPLGIEQGFTLAATPATSRIGNLTLAVALDGIERVDASGAGLMLTIPGDGTVQYGHLLVTDARGRTLPAWFVPVEGGVQIVVNDRAAVYPVTVDPLVQAGKLVASDAASGDEFGFSVAVSSDGNLALIGADGKGGFTGAAYIFTRSGGAWTERQKLTASDAAANEGYGVSVALSGVSNDGFGFSVSLSGDESLALIGAEGCSCSSNGAAYVYTRSVNTWGNEQKLTASDGAAGDAF
ncbi:MAG TPA: FG-GAP repeat protein, partial [Thermomicrobiales bacterium]